MSFMWNGEYPFSNGDLIFHGSNNIHYATSFKSQHNPTPPFLQKQRGEGNHEIIILSYDTIYDLQEISMNKSNFFRSNFQIVHIVHMSHFLL